MDEKLKNKEALIPIAKVKSNIEKVFKNASNNATHLLNDNLHIKNTMFITEELYDGVVYKITFEAYLDKK